MPFPTDIQGLQWAADPTAVPKPGVGIGEPSLATNSTTGFAHIPTMAGAPSGVPTLITGMAPIVLDTTNNRIYAYFNGAWHYWTMTA